MRGKVGYALRPSIIAVITSEEMNHLVGFNITVKIHVLGAFCVLIENNIFSISTNEPYYTFQTCNVELIIVIFQP